MSILKTKLFNQLNCERFLNEVGEYVTVFGSAKEIFEDDQQPYSQLAQQLGQTLASNGFKVMTGGGPGLMMQTNKGAYQVDQTKSIGCSINIFSEKPNAYLERSIEAKSLSLRKRVLIENAKSFICLPGGYGSFDEIFEVMTLIKIGHLPRKPKIFLLDRAFWQPLEAFLTTSYQNNTVSHDELKLYEVVDSFEPILNHLTITSANDIKAV